MWKRFQSQIAGAPMGPFRSRTASSAGKDTVAEAATATSLGGVTPRAGAAVTSTRYATVEEVHAHIDHLMRARLIDGDEAARILGDWLMAHGQGLAPDWRNAAVMRGSC